MSYTFAIEEVELSYNIKWTMLKVVQYIVNNSDLKKKVFGNKKLDDEHFADAIRDSYTAVPVFAVEYDGVRQISNSAYENHIYRLI